MEKDIECDKNLLKFLGYKKGLKPIEFDTRLNKLADYLFNFIFTTKESFGLNNGSDLRKDARLFFNNYGLILNNIVVADENTYLKAVLLYMKKIVSLKDLILIINNLFNKVSPYELPIIIDGDSTCLYYYDPSIGNLYKNKGIPLVFNSIKIVNDASDSLASYIHELTHSQLYQHKGVIKDFYNEELLSIFFELLFAYDSFHDRFKYCVYDKLIDLQAYLCFLNCYNKKDDYEYDLAMSSSKYVISTLKAFKLFDIYCSRNEEEKKYIINSIQDVFNGEMTLEELLKDLEITENNSKDKSLLLKHI